MIVHRFFLSWYSNLNPMNRITLKELAKELDISISSVSKALNDSHEISDETKAKVKAIAQLRNYQPNIQAKFLKLGKTNNIGVIISTIVNPFQAQVIEALHKESVKYGFNLILMQSLDSEEIEEKAIRTLLQHGVDGILISPAFANSNIDLLTSLNKSNCPVVIFDRITSNLETFKIGIDNFKSVYNAVIELLKINRPRIALLCGKNIGISQERIAGYVKALEDHNIEVDESLIVQCRHDYCSEEIDKDLHLKIKELLESKTPPNAILGTTDTLTTRVLGILSNMNIKVPEDIAVIGFSNSDIANSLNPSLSTILQPTQEIAKLSFEKIIELLSSKNRHRLELKSYLLETSIQLRQSTAVK